MPIRLHRSSWFWLAAAAVIGLLVFGGWYTASKFVLAPALTHWGVSQLPPSFPIYPGAEPTGSSVATSDCTYVEVDWRTSNSPDAVLNFYRERMAQPPWQLMEEEPQTVTFLGSGRDQVFGRVQVATGGPPTHFRYLGQRPYDAFGQFQPACLTPNPRQRAT
jgi:hypothetical protein